VLLVRLLVVTALAVSGWVHLDLAGSFDGLGEQISVGTLFRVQGVTALAVALWLLVRRRDRLAVLAALAVGLASALAVVLSVYVRLPAIGPLPELYEPVWYRDKVVSAVAAGLAAAGAAVLLARALRARLT
jgi:hypothetical protein